MAVLLYEEYKWKINSKGIVMKNTTLVLLTLLSLSATNAVVAQPNGQLPKNLQVNLQQAVNINQATINQLIELKGIGKKKAAAIVSYRQEHGNFMQLEELLKVKGIGKKFLQDNHSILKI